MGLRFKTCADVHFLQLHTAGEEAVNQVSAQSGIAGTALHGAAVAQSNPLFDGESHSVQITVDENVQAVHPLGQAMQIPDFK